MASPTSDISEEPVAMTTDNEVVVKVEEQADTSAMSHKELMDKVKGELAQLMKDDTLLNDLPGEVTLEEVKSQIALEYGQAMTVFVRRDDDQTMPVVVTQNATVQELKRLIRTFVNLKLSREGGKRCISWRYIWKRYWLYFDGEKLSDDNKLLKDYGIHNKCEVSFRKRLSKRGLGDVN
ncbi:U11/U12 small nuclear ribonucleoprotein 25 kDa protein-like [Liolophura sinensis]|uniref:U11/U12 small nuclear ribonucleoprotein 25 kDa protein-like n=1 Tax=Liolophura sinensis TaxID=3198878 RepID=UPI0031598744